jgi:hypothetical protein
VYIVESRERGLTKIGCDVLGNLPEMLISSVQARRMADTHEGLPVIGSYGGKSTGSNVTDSGMGVSSSIVLARCGSALMASTPEAKTREAILPS